MVTRIYSRFGLLRAFDLVLDIVGFHADLLFT